MSVVPSMVRTVKTPIIPRDDDPTARIRSRHCESMAASFDLGVCAPLEDELPGDPEPTAEDREWIAACNLDSFVPHGLAFTDWLAEQARQHQLREDRPWHQWLGRKIDELAQLAHFMQATTPELYDDRLGYYEEEAKERAYCAGYKAAETPEPEYGYGAGR